MLTFSTAGILRLASAAVDLPGKARHLSSPWCSRQCWSSCSPSKRESGNFPPRIPDEGHQPFRDGILEFTDFGAVVALRCAAARRVGCRPASETGLTLVQPSSACGQGHPLFRLSDARAEYADALRSPRALRDGAVSILWTVSRAWRLPCVVAFTSVSPLCVYAGSALFTVVHPGVLRATSCGSIPSHRIIGFIVLGILVLAGSFIIFVIARDSTIKSSSD